MISTIFATLLFVFQFLNSGVKCYFLYIRTLIISSHCQWADRFLITYTTFCFIVALTLSFKVTLWSRVFTNVLVLSTISHCFTTHLRLNTKLHWSKSASTFQNVKERYIHLYVGGISYRLIKLNRFYATTFPKKSALIRLHINELHLMQILNKMPLATNQFWIWLFRYRIMNSICFSISVKLSSAYK